MRVEQAVVSEVLHVLRPSGIEAALQAATQLEKHADEQHRQLELALEQARFEAERARRQYDLADPENRLVAGELERRWNEALQTVHRREQQLAARDEAGTFELTPAQRETLLALGRDLPSVWHHPASPAPLKKRLLRAVLEEIVVFVEHDTIRLLLHWQGGDHTSVQVLRNGNGQHRWKTDLETEQLIRELAPLIPDRDIASLLNRLGKRTAKDNTWTQARVCTFRNARQVPAYQPGERQERGEMTVQEVADALQVSPMTVHRLIRRKLLPAKQLCVGAP